MLILKEYSLWIFISFTSLLIPCLHLSVLGKSSLHVPCIFRWKLVRSTNECSMLWYFRYGRWVTRRVALGSIAAIWILAALISFLPISLGIHTSQDPWEYTETGIRYYTCAMDLLPIYAVLSSCISFYIPTLVGIQGRTKVQVTCHVHVYVSNHTFLSFQVMLGIYLRLYMYAQKHVKSIRAVTKPFDNSNYSSDQPHAVSTEPSLG